MTLVIVPVCCGHALYFHDTNHYQSNGDFPTFLKQKRKQVIKNGRTSAQPVDFCVRVGRTGSVGPSATETN